MAMDLSEFEQQHFVVQQVDEPSMSKSLDQLAMELSDVVAYLSFGDFGTKPEINNGMPENITVFWQKVHPEPPPVVKFE